MGFGLCPAGDGKGEGDDERHVIDDVPLRPGDAHIKPRRIHLQSSRHGLMRCRAGKAKRVAGAFSVELATAGCEVPPGTEFGW